MPQPPVELSQKVPVGLNHKADRASAMEAEVAVRVDVRLGFRRDIAVLTAELGGVGP